MLFFVVCSLGELTLVEGKFQRGKKMESSLSLANVSLLTTRAFVVNIFKLCSDVDTFFHSFKLIKFDFFFDFRCT